jgi:hypothetical protein
MTTFCLASGATTWAAESESVFAPGHESALNQICGQGRSGRSWDLVAPEAEARTVESLVETVVPSPGRTDIIRIMPMAIIPCIRVIVATDAAGITTWDLAVDAENVNRDFVLTDIHTGEPLQFCPARPTAPRPGLEARAAGAGSSDRFSRGHQVALNTLCGEGRSGRTWTLGTDAMTETIVPATGRTDVVSIMPMAIIPCVRVSVATDELGQTRYDMAVDAENVNRGFRITDIHTGESLRLCPTVRSESPSILPALPTSWSAIKAGR